MQKECAYPQYAVMLLRDLLREWCCSVRILCLCKHLKMCSYLYLLDIPTPTSHLTFALVAIRLPLHHLPAKPPQTLLTPIAKPIVAACFLCHKHAISTSTTSLWYGLSPKQS